MSLLRAARGGVIEDLTVDWGVQDTPSKDEKSFDDDFEMISGETASTKTAVEPPAPAPISLFDTSTPSTSEDLGPKKMIIHLAPPPRIQQAPKSDKLPIPLYPGFRCSIFSIIKVSGQTSFSSCVRINGNVMGSPVSLELPVTPIALDGGAATHLTDIKVKLLHSLAARALIQDWEDKGNMEKNRAEIERLGKRYSLASSATSFLAVDDDTKKEVEKEEVHYQWLEYRVSTARARPLPQPVFFASQQLVRGSAARSAAPAPPLVPPPAPPSFGGTMGSMGGGGGARTKLLSRSAAAPPPPRPPPPAPALCAMATPVVLQRSSGGQEEYNAVNYGAPGAGYMSAYSSAPITEVFTQAPDALADYGGVESERFSLRLSAQSFSPGSSHITALSGGAPTSAPTPAPVSYTDSYGSAPIPAPASHGGTLTVEAIARAQQFDGGFPVSSDFIRLLTGSSSAPSLPGELAALSGSSQEKQIIWVTVLVIAVLAKKFGGDKDSWEMLAEKSTEFVETSLVSMGVDSGNAVTVINQLKTAAARSV